eukprot:6001367-Karenia_brevis.AAC.1
MSEQEFRQAFDAMQNKINQVIDELTMAKGNNPNVTQRIYEIEKRVLAMEGKVGPDGQRTGLAQMFDGKTPDYYPRYLPKKKGPKPSENGQHKLRHMLSCQIRKQDKP